MPQDQVILLVFWAVLILGTVILELATENLVSIWFSIGAIIALALNLLGLSPVAQFGSFVVGSALCLILFKPLTDKLMDRSEVRTNADRFIGLTGEVTRDIPDDGSRGEVKVNGTFWSAFTTGNEVIPVGTRIIVQDIVGNKLLVARITEKEV